MQNRSNQEALSSAVISVMRAVMLSENICRGPLSHGVSDLAFDVTYIRQDGNVAWDVGTYRVNVPLNDGTKKEDHGKYLTVWKWVDAKWLISAE